MSVYKLLRECDGRECGGRECDGRECVERECDERMREMVRDIYESK